MARIPVYEARQTPSGLINVSASPVQQTTAIGRALEGMGNTLDKIGQDIARDINEARVREVDNEASENIRSMLYDPESGYLAKTGKDAVDGFQAVQDGIRKLQADLNGKLQSTAQRKMFTDVMTRRVQSALGSVSGHAAQQAKVYNLGQASARADMAMSDGVANYSDPVVFGRAKATMLQEAAFDKSGAEAELARRIALTKLHQGVINQMLSQDRAAMAREWFAQNQGEIDATVQDDLRKNLQSASSREDSLNLSIQLMASSSDYNAQRKTLKDMYAAGKISADVYDATQQRIDQEKVRREAAKAQISNEMEGRAQEWILQNPGKSVLEMPANIYTWAKGAGRLDSLSTFARTSGKPSANPEMFTQMTIMAADDPIGFVKRFDENSAVLRTQMSEGEYNSLLSRRSAISKNDLAAQNAVTVAARTVKSIAADLKAAGIDTTPKEGSTAAQQLASFNGQLITAIDAATQSKGSALTIDEARKVGLSLLQEGKLKGSGTFWDTTKKRFEVTADERAKFPFVATDYADIPDRDRRAIATKIASSPDLQRKLGLAGKGGVTLTGAKFERAVELLYQAQSEGVQF